MERLERKVNCNRLQRGDNQRSFVTFGVEPTFLRERLGPRSVLDQVPCVFPKLGACSRLPYVHLLTEHPPRSRRRGQHIAEDLIIEAQEE